MKLGKHIRENRLRINLTQEKLAEKLNVTAQAVSKWESGTGMPDIALLPELSAIFGVTIDELFETSEEMHLNRIEAMVEKETMLSRSDFDYAVSRLESMLYKTEHKGRCLTLLADLFLHRSNGYAEKAAELAKQALDICPENHDNHRILFHACHGALGDWCCTNHARLIDYYKTFVQKNPNHLPGYMWLIDNLIADHRTAEAAKYLDEYAVLPAARPFVIPVYRAQIALAEFDKPRADAIMAEAEQYFGSDPGFLFEMAQYHAKTGNYQQAIAYYEKSWETEPEKPRYTDALDAICILYEILGDYQNAIAACDRLLCALREEWGYEPDHAPVVEVQKRKQELLQKV